MPGDQGCRDGLRNLKASNAPGRRMMERVAEMIDGVGIELLVMLYAIHISVMPYLPPNTPGVTTPARVHDNNLDRNPPEAINAREAWVLSKLQIPGVDMMMKSPSLGMTKPKPMNVTVIWLRMRLRKDPGDVTVVLRASPPGETGRHRWQGGRAYHSSILTLGDRL